MAPAPFACWYPGPPWTTASAEAALTTTARLAGSRSSAGWVLGGRSEDVLGHPGRRKRAASGSPRARALRSPRPPTGVPAPPSGGWWRARATELVDVVAGGAHSSETAAILSPGTDECALLVVTFTSSMSTPAWEAQEAAVLNSSEGRRMPMAPSASLSRLGRSFASTSPSRPPRGRHPRRGSRARRRPSPAPVRPCRW